MMMFVFANLMPFLGRSAPMQFPTKMATLSEIPIGIMFTKLIKLEIPIAASSSSTPSQPAKTLMISKHHHSRHRTNAEGIPYLRYRFKS